MQAGAVPRGKLEHALIGHQDHNVPGGVENRGTDLAGFQMAVNL
jgi:hypothetical protein